MDGDHPTLRLLTCGSVDDGKSTLIGRLLYETHLIPEDQLAALAQDATRGTDGQDLDLALLVDGLEAEREQGITIDVAYRYFSTPRRSFIVADTPGHEQYTRNMVTGAATAQLAILLVDARKGLLPQTHRHAAIASLMRIRHVILAVNKMDLVGYGRPAFDEIVSSFRRSAEPLGFATITPVPISARAGDNISVRSAAMSWYTGPTLLSALEAIDARDDTGRAFRLPVQWVNRPHLNFRGFAGTIVSGRVRVGDLVAVAPAGTHSRVAGIIVAGQDAPEARAGDAATLTLADEVDVARGDVLCHPDARPEVGEQFAAHLIWMGEEPLHVGRSYLMKMGPLTVPAAVIELRHRLNVATHEQLAARTLELNEIGACKIAAARRIAFETYASNREMGGFILIDRASDATVAAGVIDHHLRRSENVHYQPLTVSKKERAAQKLQTPLVLWFTGLSGAGKSTIANLVEAKLHARGIHTMLLDGDNLRLGLNRDLGFTENDRIENIRRIGEVAKLMIEGGLITLCSFISPFAADRQMVREMFAPGEFVEIFVDAPIDTVIARDPKGLYRRALAGQIKNFTGVDQPYEPPSAPELWLATTADTADVLADRVVSYLEAVHAIELSSVRR